jgi:uncharacterized protein (TIGR00290 family)
MSRPNGDRAQVFLSWSGGKDSALALAALRRDPAIEVVGLMTSITRPYDRISIHGVRRALLIAQARSLGLPLAEVPIDAHCTNDEYEAALHRALGDIKGAWPRLSGIAFGDLFLEDVRRYRERSLADSGVDLLFPLWGIDTAELAHKVIADGYVARVVCVDTTQLAGEFTGRLFDERLLADLPPGVDPCGERGEFHTFVSDGPLFDAPISYTIGEKVLRDDRFMYCDLAPGF